MKNIATHVTKAGANIYVDLGFPNSDAVVLQMKADLHTEIIQVVRSKKYTSRALEKLFDEPQPRISQLLCGKISKLSIAKLIGYALKLGIRPKIAFELDSTAQ